MSLDVPQPELGVTVKRRYGPYDIQRFDDLLQASVGATDLGKVHVDCKFLFRESRWGTLDNRKAGIIYLDLTFSQPGDCRLSSAIIKVTLDDEDTYLAQIAKEPPSGNAPSPLQIRKCGPLQMLGHPRYETVTTHNQVIPKFEIASFAGAGGVGHESTKRTVRDCWWKFEGLMKASDKSKTGAYKVLQWHVTENELQTQPLHNNTVHTAFSFDHGCQPFFMHVEVSGRLKSKRSNIRQKILSKVKNMKFPPSSRDSRYTTTLIYFKDPDMFTTPLDKLERELEDAMQRCNMTHPVVVSKSQDQSAESQLPTPIHQSSMDSLTGEYQLLEDIIPDAPTVDEFKSHSEKIFKPVMATNDSDIGSYTDVQGEDIVEATAGRVDLQIKILPEEVNLNIFIVLMKIWIIRTIRTIGTILGYGGNNTN
ncbi:hypothetical protein F4678DRAFT_206869 [Xylaria arbuscula]|nr:hypothetical protein F4678DRAFT_206869 [Xylaria arbuscula]